MTVRPTTSGQTPNPGVNRTGMPAVPATPARPSDASAAPPIAQRRDDVQISSQARELQQMDSGNSGPAGEIQPDRLKEVLNRVSGGYYDQPSVRNEVVRRLSQDL